MTNHLNKLPYIAWTAVIVLLIYVVVFAVWPHFDGFAWFGNGQAVFYLSINTP